MSEINASADRYVDVKCATCGWRHLIAPRERDHPCEAVAPCPGKVSDPEDRTFECVPQGFRSRVAALLRKVETSGAAGFKEASCCPSCEALMGCEGDAHAEGCALAALLREAEG